MCAHHNNTYHLQTFIGISIENVKVMHPKTVEIFFLLFGLKKESSILPSRLKSHSHIFLFKVAWLPTNGDFNNFLFNFLATTIQRLRVTVPLIFPCYYSQYHIPIFVSINYTVFQEIKQLRL